MKSAFLFGLVPSLILGLLGGCSKKDTNSELQKAAATMAQPEPAAPQSPMPQQVEQTRSEPVTPKDQAQEMNQALAAYKGGDFNDAVVRLQKLRATPVMSPEKRIAVNDAIAAVTSEIYALAQKGDARAIQALKTYEEMQTRPR